MPLRKSLEVFLWKVRLFLKRMVVILFGKRTSILTDEQFNKLIFMIVFAKKPDLVRPRTFNEWVCFRKTRSEEIEKWRFTDKYEVRDFVRESIGDKYLIKCLGIYNSFDSIDFNELPSAFVMKCTHGSSYNMIVRDKQQLRTNKCRKQFQKWLSRNYYFEGREKNYIKIIPRIMIEDFLNPKGFLDEYKLFCFFGSVKFVQHNRCIKGARCSNIYDNQWKYIDVKYGYPNFRELGLPEDKKILIRLAEELAKPFDFVRVDLYVADGKVYFSELTFNPGGGFVPFNPKRYDELFGRFFQE